MGRSGAVQRTAFAAIQPSSEARRAPFAAKHPFVPSVSKGATQATESPEFQP